MIKSKQLARALYELSLGRSQTGEAKDKNLHGLENKFFDFIKEKKLEAQLPSVLYHLEKIEELEREKNGIQIEVAHEIKPETVQKIKLFLIENLPARNTTHNVAGGPEIVKIQKGLIAGFRAKWNGVIYDSSIETGLKKLKEQIIN